MGGTSPLNLKSLCYAATLTDAKGNSLGLGTAALRSSGVLRSVFVLLFTADIGLINLDISADS